jgi:hypothetical protein
VTALKIYVFKSGTTEPETKITIPLGVLRVASKLVPKKATEALEKEGIDLNEILALSESEDIRGTLSDIIYSCSFR